MANTQSTITLQNEVDAISNIGDIHPVLDVAQGLPEPICTMANDVITEMFATGVPWKFNEALFPPFVLNSCQQDYASTVTNLAWMQRSIAVDINNTAIQKPQAYVEVGRDQQQNTGAYQWRQLGFLRKFTINYLPNSQLYYGTWGDAQTGNPSLGNNPVSGSVYTSPYSAGGAMPNNPITQIQDANGNLLQLTGYGTEGTTAPVAPANSAPGVVATPGSGATTTWTVLDPQAVGIRIDCPPAPSGVVWQFRLVYQMKPIRFTSLSQTLYPITDDFEPHFRRGLIAQCYLYSPEAKINAKFEKMHGLWMQGLMDARTKTERERDEYRFVPQTSIQQRGRGGRFGWLGPANPLMYNW
jgi:hypothetical protein